MKWLLIPAFFILASFADAQTPWLENQMQVVVFPSEPSHYDLIRSMGTDAEQGNGFLRCYITPDELRQLSGKGIPYEVEIENLNAWSASFGSRGVPSGYYTVSELDEIADSLATNFPEICSREIIGIATGFSNIYVLKISDNVGEDENEPEILFDGGIHGDEVGGPENMIRFARDLCLGYNNDPYITGLINEREIFIIYCLNPYGRNNMTRYNQAWVDINRDCGYMWNAEGNSPSAFSQPETKALRKIMTENQFVMHLSYHSGTEYISYPWSYRQAPTPDAAQHNFLASRYAAVSGYTSIPYGQGFTGMYAINGSTKDFGYGALGAISWSVEISLSKQPPASQIVPYYLKNKQSMLEMVEYSGYGIRGTVTDANTGEPVPATIYVNNMFPVHNDPVAGDFHKFLVPGQYNIKVIANGYEPATEYSVPVTDRSVATVDFVLQPAPSHYARRIISCRIPGNNPADEGFTPAATGPPDNVRYSIGRYGWVVLDMGTPVADAEGADITVHENDATPEGYQVFAGSSMDGPWVLLGSGTGTISFDLASGGLPEAQYFKITDDGDGTAQVSDAGFDLDALEAMIPAPPPPDTTGWIEGIVYSPFPLFEPVADAEVYTGIYTTFSDNAGRYRIQADTGYVKLCAEKQSENFYKCDTVYVASGDTTNHNLYLDMLERANPGEPAMPCIMPNPAGNSTVLLLPKLTADATLILTDLSGRIIARLRRDGADTIVLDLSPYNPGIYLLNMKYPDGSVTTQKLIIIR